MVYEILRKLQGGEGVISLVLLPHGRLAYVHSSSIPYLFLLNVAINNGIWVTCSAVASLPIEDVPISVCTD